VSDSAGETSGARPRVLCVDDDQLVTASLRRVLQRQFDVAVTNAAADALALLSSSVARGPAFAVVVADYQMPDMNGAALLHQARQISPDTVRLLLTGRADPATAVSAVNEGQIFRFLSKPIAPDALVRAVQAAVDQHRLLTSERVLLEQTLHGSIKALISLLALARPTALGRTTRVKQHVSALAERVTVPDRWSLEIAALLSQVGWVTLPEPALQKLAAGEPLTDEEHALVADVPSVAERLIADIPRLEAVREILRFQDTRYDGVGSPTPGVAGDAIPVGARVLKVVLDFDLLELQGKSAAEALDVMAARTGWYDPEVLLALRLLQPGSA